MAPIDVSKWLFSRMVEFLRVDVNFVICRILFWRTDARLIQPRNPSENCVGVGKHEQRVCAFGQSFFLCHANARHCGHRVYFCLHSFPSNHARSPLRYRGKGHGNIKGHTPQRRVSFLRHTHHYDSLVRDRNTFCIRERNSGVPTIGIEFSKRILCILWWFWHRRRRYDGLCRDYHVFICFAIDFARFAHYDEHFHWRCGKCLWKNGGTIFRAVWNGSGQVLYCKLGWRLS